MIKLPFLLVALALGTACAEPVYYSFTGVVTQVLQFGGQYTSEQTGGSVSFVLEVDTARPAYILNRGAKSEIKDTLDAGQGYRADHYFDSLITPSFFTPIVSPASGKFVVSHTAKQSGADAGYTANFLVEQGNSGEKNYRFTMTMLNRDANKFLPKLDEMVLADAIYWEGSGTPYQAVIEMEMFCTAISPTKPNAIRERAHERRSRVGARMAGGFLIDPSKRVFLASGRRAIPNR